MDKSSKNYRDLKVIEKDRFLLAWGALDCFKIDLFYFLRKNWIEK